MRLSIRIFALTVVLPLTVPGAGLAADDHPGTAFCVHPPHAALCPLFPDHHVVRCWKMFESTAAVNTAWQARLNGTVWANYMLVSTQWRGANKSPLFEAGEVPRFLTNTTMETYLQYDKTGSCLGCHSGAKTAAGRSSNFTFLLSGIR